MYKYYHRNNSDTDQCFAIWKKWIYCCGIIFVPRKNNRFSRLIWISDPSFEMMEPIVWKKISTNKAFNHLLSDYVLSWLKILKDSFDIKTAPNFSWKNSELSKKVGVRGLEPRTPASQTRCGTNCATPRKCSKSIHSIW